VSARARETETVRRGVGRVSRERNASQRTHLFHAPAHPLILLPTAVPHLYSQYLTVPSYRGPWNARARVRTGIETVVYKMDKYGNCSILDSDSILGLDAEKPIFR